MAKLTSMDKIVERADERMKRLRENMQRTPPPGHRAASEREQVAVFLKKTPQDHCQGVLEHGPKAYGQYLQRMDVLKKKYDRRRSDNG